MATMDCIFLMAFLSIISMKFISAADDAIRCHGNIKKEVAASAVNVLAVCAEHLNTSVTALGEEELLLSLDGAFFHLEIPLNLLQHSQFWVTYCRDWPQFESCATGEARNSTSLEVDLLRTAVKAKILKAWRSIGLFPVPVLEKWACNGSELSDRLRNVYDYGETKECDVESVKKCLKEWHQDLGKSGFLETTDGSPFDKIEWLIRRARMTYNCSRMSLESCANQKLIEFINFVITQSIPFNISKQVIETDDETKNEAHNGAKRLSSLSFLPISKAFNFDIWIFLCFVQIVLH